MPAIYPESLIENLERDLQIELALSKIDKRIGELNFKAVVGDDAFHAAVPNPDRRNDGRLTEYYLRLHDQFKIGGWHCFGIDPLTMKFSEYGCFKCAKPRINKDGKEIKYEGTHGETATAFCLRVTFRIGLKIATRNGLTAEAKYLKHMEGFEIDDEDRDFWQWVIDNPEIKISITEGVKKAGSLLSAGYCAIALPGINNGYRADKYTKYSRSLVPQLKVFAQKDREFIFAFDNDIKPTTIANVRNAIKQTGKLLEKEGCKVSVMTWKHCEYKGIDDLIFALGAEALDYVYERKRTFGDWELAEASKLSKYIHHLTINPENNPSFFDKKIRDGKQVYYVNPERIKQWIDEETNGDLAGKVIVLKWAKGTGKTNALAKLTESFLYEGNCTGILGLTPRIQLGQSLAKSLEISYFDEKRGKGRYGYVLCFDSLGKVTLDAFEGSAIVIDEAEQSLFHLHTSGTLENKRSSVLEYHANLIKQTKEAGGTLFLLDADMTDLSIDHYKELGGYGDEDIIVIESEYLPNKGRIINMTNQPSQVIAEIEEALKNGEKVILFVAAQEHTSRYSTTTLYHYFKNLFPDIRIIAIDSKTTNTKGHPAEKAASRINDLVKNYDLVIASPTLETGVSIEATKEDGKSSYFDKVFAIANGIQGVNSVCQVLERVRFDVPRTLAVTTDSVAWGRIGNGSSNHKALLASNISNGKALTKTMTRFFNAQREILNADAELRCGKVNTDTWALLSARHNLGLLDYRNNIRKKLETEGYEVNYTQCKADKGIVETLKEIVKENTAKCNKDVLDTPNPSNKEFDELSEKTIKTDEERLQEKKGSICRKYSLINSEVTLFLIERDDADDYYSQLKLRYYLIHDKRFVAIRDKEKIEESKFAGQVFTPDVNKFSYSAKVGLLEDLDIDRFLEPGKTWDDASVQNYYDHIKKHCVYPIKDILGISIAKIDKPIQGIGMILNKIGLKFSMQPRSRVDGKQVRSYLVVENIPHLNNKKDAALRAEAQKKLAYFTDLPNTIFARWRERDEAKLAEMLASAETKATETTPQIDISNFVGGVVSPQKNTESNNIAIDSTQPSTGNKTKFDRQWSIGDRAKYIGAAEQWASKIVAILDFRIHRTPKKSSIPQALIKLGDLEKWTDLQYLTPIPI